MSTWNANYELLPRNTDALGRGDDEIRDLKGAIRERVGNEHTEYNEDSTSGTNTKDWIHKGGSAVGLLQDAEPASRLSGEALGNTARDKGFIWFDDNNDDLFCIWTGAAFAYPGLALSNRTSDPASPVTGQIWIRTDL